MPEGDQVNTLGQVNSNVSGSIYGRQVVEPVIP